MHAADGLLRTLCFAPGTPLDLDRLGARWRRVAARPLLRLVALEGCALWLDRRLDQLGLAAAVDADFAAGLAGLARRIAALNLLVDAEAQTVARAFGEQGIPFVLMKGVARRALAGRYPFADARATRDVDILLPEARAREGWDLLRSRGYDYVKPSRASRVGHHHLASVWGPARVSVEVHTSVARNVPPHLAWERMVGASTEVDFGGVGVRVPSATELCWASIAHGLRHPEDSFRLALLLDPAVIWVSGAPVDWGEMRQRLDQGEVPDRASAGRWLGAVARVVGRPVPAPLADAARPYRLDRVLRWRHRALRVVAPTERVTKGILRTTRYLGF